MKMAFVCSPFGWDYENMKQAKKYANALHLCFSKSGYMFIVPHLIFPQYISKSQESEGIEYCKELLKRSDVIVVCGRLLSPGMVKELEQAACQEKDIFHARFLVGGGLSFEKTTKEFIFENCERVVKK